MIVITGGIYLAQLQTLPLPAKSMATTIPQVIETIKAPEISIKISPEKIIQGEPVLVEVIGTSTVRSIKFEGKALNIFENNEKPSALVGIDLRKIPGRYPVVITLGDGTVIKENVVVGKRAMVIRDFHIPEKLGGDTEESKKELVNTLVQEAAIINAIPTGGEKLWEGKFRFPVENPFVTDTYGYSRETVGSSIAHKGTDFRAKVGTPVLAMDTGTVRYTGYLRNYGHTIVLDHGLGLQTIYMHLSEVLVKNGENVSRRQLIAKSGDTGYTLGPHLHLSVKINHISIDPLKFMEILGDI